MEFCVQIVFKTYLSGNQGFWLVNSKKDIVQVSGKIATNTKVQVNI